MGKRKSLAHLDGVSSRGTRERLSSMGFSALPFWRAAVLAALAPGCTTTSSVGENPDRAAIPPPAASSTAPGSRGAVEGDQDASTPPPRRAAAKKPPPRKTRHPT